MSFKKRYLSVFADKRLYLYALFDILLVAMLYVSITSFGGYIQSHSAALQGLDLNGLMQQDPAKASATLDEIKSFLIVFVVVIVGLFIASIIAFSLLQGIIENDLTNQKMQKLARWIPFNLVILLPLAIAGLALAIINLLAQFIFNLLPVIVASILKNITILYLFTIFLIIVHLIYKHFVMSHKMWASIGDGFHFVFHNKLKLAQLGLVGTLGFFLVGLLLIPLQYFSVSITTIYFLSTPLYLLICEMIRIQVHSP